MTNYGAGRSGLATSPLAEGRRFKDKIDTCAHVTQLAAEISPRERARTIMKDLSCRLALALLSLAASSTLSGAAATATAGPHAAAAGTGGSGSAPAAAAPLCFNTSSFSLRVDPSTCLATATLRKLPAAIDPGEPATSCLRRHQYHGNSCVHLTCICHSRRDWRNNVRIARYMCITTCGGGVGVGGHVSRVKKKGSDMSTP